MRSSTLIVLGTTAATALSLPAFLQQKTSIFRSYLQQPLSSPNKMTTTSSSGLSIADVLPQSRQINVFSGLTRDVDPISARLDDLHQNSTILAPLNSAIKSLERKPWEDEDEISALGETNAYSLGDGERRAHDNLRKFVERHIVPVSPWKEGEKVQTLAGKEIWWEDKDGEKVIMPGNVKVDSVVSRVENGQVWILDGVLSK